ncbi:MAG: cation transporter [Planctomycetota bacterium]|nr:MAG: cation transporter [Planctomycetota bacterium]
MQNSYLLLILVVLHTGIALIKIISGFFGHSYALIADGIESAIDVLSTLLLWSSFKIANKPPDKNHPFGHGKVESLAALSIASLLLGGAFLIAYQSIQAILHLPSPPEVFTLYVLIGVILFKEILFRYLFHKGKEENSTALKSEAWHQRSDAITSLAAFLGISIALIGGEAYRSADGWAALVACVIIGFNGLLLFRAALDEILDASPPKEILAQIRSLAEQVEGVMEIEKLRVRKAGPSYIVDIHVQVDGNLTVSQGHFIGHQVKSALCTSHLPIIDVHLHVEPFEGPCLAPEEELEM